MKGTGAFSVYCVATCCEFVIISKLNIKKIKGVINQKAPTMAIKKRWLLR